MTTPDLLGEGPVQCAVCGAERPRTQMLHLGVVPAAQTGEIHGWRCMDDKFGDKHLREEWGLYD